MKSIVVNLQTLMSYFSTTRLTNQIAYDSYSYGRLRVLAIFD